jgi:hypothetical protein
MDITATGVSAVNTAITRHRPVNHEAACRCGTRWTREHFLSELSKTLPGRGHIDTTQHPWTVIEE